MLAEKMGYIPQIVIDKMKRLAGKSAIVIGDIDAPDRGVQGDNEQVQPAMQTHTPNP